MRKLMLVTGILLMLVSAAGAYWFQPWKLFTSTTVNDTAPVILESGAPTQAPAGSAPSATLVAQGQLISHEHATSGTVQLVKLEDGSHQIILRSFATTDGPDLRVWLTDQPVIPGVQGWRLFDDGNYRDLGSLKGNKGTQVYDIPADVDPSQYRSITIWCKRFKVSFGAAQFG
jgi:electron transfer DM13